MQKKEDGQCVLMVTTSPSDVPQELESVDGVSMQCLMKANPGMDGEVSMACIYCGFAHI